MVGLLCKAWDADVSDGEMILLDDINNRSAYPYYNASGFSWRNCKPLTSVDLRDHLDNALKYEAGK